MDLQSEHFAEFCRKSGVKYTDKNFRILWNYIKNVKWPDASADSIIHSNVFAAAFLDVKDQLEFTPPPEPGPTEEQLRAERTRRLEAHHNIGPMSAKADPRKIDNPDGSADALRSFVNKAIGNLEKDIRGELPQKEKPKPFRTIPADVTPEQLRNGDWSVAEIKDYLARRNRTPEKK